MEEINTVAQLKFASQHLFNLICFIGILYYFLKKPVSSFFVNRSKNIEESINTFHLSPGLNSEIAFRQPIISFDNSILRGSESSLSLIHI